MNDKKYFISELHPIARKVAQESGMFSELISVQAAQESGLRKQQLQRLGSNKEIAEKLRAKQACVQQNTIHIRSARMRFKRVVVMVFAVVIGACQANMPSSAMADVPASPKKTSEIAVPLAGNASELSGHKDEFLAEQLNAFVEGNTKILDSQQGDLKGNGERGAVLVLDHQGTGNEKLGEGVSRTLLLLARDGTGELQKVGKNDRLIPCAQCGGMAGDPFGYMQVDEGRFTVLTEGGSRERWSNEYTFKYSTEKQDWLLDKTVRTVTDTETGEEKRVELTSKEFGTIHFEAFDPAILSKAEGK